jgi:hypothetical protein
VDRGLVFATAIGAFLTCDHRGPHAESDPAEAPNIDDTKGPRKFPLLSRCARVENKKRAKAALFDSTMRVFSRVAEIGQWRFDNQGPSAGGGWGGARLLRLLQSVQTARQCANAVAGLRRRAPNVSVACAKSRGARTAPAPIMTRRPASAASAAEVCSCFTCGRRRALPVHVFAAWVRRVRPSRFGSR